MELVGGKSILQGLKTDISQCAMVGAGPLRLRKIPGGWS